MNLTEKKSSSMKRYKIYTFLGVPASTVNHREDVSFPRVAQSAARTVPSYQFSPRVQQQRGRLPLLTGAVTG